MFKQILVPLDGSRFAELAIPYAEELAEAFNSEVSFLFVCDTPQCQQRYEHQVYIEKTAELVRQHIGGERPKTSVKPVVLEGHAAAEIVSYATSNDINLIIMGTHGCSGLLCWAMGSTADKVLARAGTPILLIRASEPAPEPRREEIFNRILLPLDGSEAGEATLPYIKELTGKLNSEVILLQVVADGKHVHTIGGLDYVRFTKEQVSSRKESVKQYLEEVGQRFAGTKAAVRTEVKTGDTAEEIINFADETGASVVAMSTHGHSGIERWVLGSITHRILHHGNTPILVVRASGAKS